MEKWEKKMTKNKKILEKILKGEADSNIQFAGLCHHSIQN
jgi:hypothetical protein